MARDRLLIANRGEIAVRIIRAARELDLEVITIFSEPDVDSLHVRRADRAICIPGKRSIDTYLNINRIIEIIQEEKIDAVHPGYGFLSEDPTFARAVKELGINYIGPQPETIQMMGDKAQARQIARQIGLETVPGSDGVVRSLDEAHSIADRIGYPILLKAKAGGGGKGIRRCDSSDDLLREWDLAAAEGAASFNSGELYVEHLIENARHIEVQILGDGENVIHLFDRECSLQRRRQKLWEEAPAYPIGEDQRKVICEGAVKLSEIVTYSGAGTVEFIYDKKTERAYFIEMNTRIQVEHGVTEAITGRDIVKEMIRIGLGQKLQWAQDDIVVRGAAIEVRLNAEDARKNFLPNIGRVEHVEWPGGPGVRIDSSIYDGLMIQPYYDSLIGKLIVYAEDRPTALSRLKRALSELEITGIKTTQDLFIQLCDKAEIVSDDIDTNSLETWLGEGII